MSKHLHTLIRRRPARHPRAAGFTLIETLLAITILVLSMSGPLSIAAKSFNSAVFAKDQITAFYLAQEAIEYVRNLRDSNALSVHTSLDAGSSQFWLSGVSSCIGASCTVEDTNTTGPSEAITLCAGGHDTCPTLRYDDTTGFYGYQNGNPSEFIRSMTLTKVTDNEYSIQSTVSWRNNGLGGQFTVQENIFNWQL